MRVIAARSPDFSGDHAKAWRLDHLALAEIIVERGAMMIDTAWVAAWICETGYDPIFPCHLLSLTHLRPIGGRPPARLNMRDASHELMVMICDPAVELDVERPLSVLQPPVFGVQLRAPADAAAIARINNTIRQICNGSFDPSDIARWTAHYGDNGLETR